MLYAFLVSFSAAQYLSLPYKQVYQMAYINHKAHPYTQIRVHKPYRLRHSSCLQTPFWAENMQFIFLIPRKDTKIKNKLKNTDVMNYIQINQPTRCINLSDLLLVVQIQLNMFRASSCPSSRAYKLQ